jgi:hypothetical protein
MALNGERNREHLSSCFLGKMGRKRRILRLKLPFLVQKKRVFDTDNTCHLRWGGLLASRSHQTCAFQPIPQTNRGRAGVGGGVTTTNFFLGYKDDS